MQPSNAVNHMLPLFKSRRFPATGLQAANLTIVHLLTPVRTYAPLSREFNFAENGR